MTTQARRLKSVKYHFLTAQYTRFWIHQQHRKKMRAFEVDSGGEKELGYFNYATKNTK